MQHKVRTIIFLNNNFKKSPGVSVLAEVLAELKKLVNKRKKASRKARFEHACYFCFRKKGKLPNVCL